MLHSILISCDILGLSIKLKTLGSVNFGDPHHDSPITTLTCYKVQPIACSLVLCMKYQERIAGLYLIVRMGQIED